MSHKTRLKTGLKTGLNIDRAYLLATKFWDYFSRAVDFDPASYTLVQPDEEDEYSSEHGVDVRLIDFKLRGKYLRLIVGIGHNPSHWHEQFSQIPLKMVTDDHLTQRQYDEWAKLNGYI